MNEFKKNGEWYSDPTSYEAIGKPAPGEVWTAKRSGVDKTVLVIAVNGDVCNIITLIDEKRDGLIPVRAKAMMYTNPVMLSYCFVDGLGEFVRKLSADEFSPIIEAIEDALEIVLRCEPLAVPPAQTPAPAPKPVTVTDPTIEAEAKIYKQLYNELLEKVLKAQLH